VSTRSTDKGMMSDSVAFDPEVNEKYVDEAKSAADEYAADGLTELELCAQYCRSCTVSVQRHFHVRSLGEVCTRAMRIGEETFPLDLVEELAQDDDGDVRQLVAEQLGVLAEALRESRTRQEDEVYTGLLCVAFLLVEDDVDGVVSAAEDAVASVAGLLEGHGARELLLTQIANLATCEEEEIRVSGAKILGSLAAVLGPEESASKLAPLLVTLAGDEQFQIREATTRAVAAVGAAARNEDAEATLVSAFRALGSTALGVVKTAFVDASAPLDEDAVVYEGEDLDAVSSLRLEKATWNAAFVDAPRRFLRVASSPPPFDFFAVSDVAHRVLLFRLIGTKALRLTAVIKGCRDASFCFHPRSGLLALHRPSVRRLETRDPRDGAVVDAVDATDVIRLIRGFTSIVVVIKTHSGDDHRVEMRPVEDSFPSSRPVPSRPASLIV